MNETLLSYNLQFFAEDLGENELEVAEPTTTDNNEPEVEETEATDTGETESDSATPDDSEVQSAEENAKYAAARRKAEQEFQARQQAEDAEFARRFAGYENPITHQPIRSRKDYFDALDAQETLRQREELQNKGIDPSLFEEMVSKQVANNPAVLQAQQVMQAAQEAQIKQRIDADVKAISKLNPSVKTIDDVLNDPNFNQMLELTRNNGLGLADAYKLVNLESLMAGKMASAKQAAINNAKGTSHLAPTDGLSGTDNGLVDIPANELNAWKRAFPNCSMKELKEKYNRSL